MIIKSYEIQRKLENFLKYNFFLLYGENDGIKKDIEEIIKNGVKKKNTEIEFLSLYENEILKGKTNFEENFKYNNRSNKFDLKKYEKNIQDNLITILSDEIIRYLNSLR